MHPILFTINDFPIPTYGPVYLISYLASVAVGAWLISGRTGKPFWTIFEIIFQFAIAGEIGARVTFVIVEWDRFAAGQIPLKQFLFSGRVVLGGVMVGTIAAIYLFRKHRLPLAMTLDAAGVGVALGLGIGRLGCLLAGCCFGKPTDLPWGIVFTDPIAQRLNGTPLNVPLHPTQLLQMASGLLIFAVLLWLFRRKHADGQIFIAFLGLVGLLRFGIEFLRGDPRGEGLGLATSQWIGLAMAVAAAVSWVLLRPKAR